MATSFDFVSAVLHCLRHITVLVSLLVCASATYGQPGAVDRSVEGRALFRGHIIFMGAGSPHDVLSHAIVSLDPVTWGQTKLVDLGDVGVLPGRISPDGQRLAFSVVWMSDLRNEGVHRNHEMPIWVVDSKRQIEELDKEGLFVSWSSDGTSLIAYQDDGHNVETFSIDLKTKNVKPFPVPLGELLRDVSPDGSILATVSRKDADSSTQDSIPSQQLFITRTDPLAKTHDRLFATKPHFYCNGARFSPDGNRIAYYECRCELGKTSAYGIVADADGDNVREVVRLYESISQPAQQRVFPSCWSPDGTQVVWLITSDPAGEQGPPSHELVFAAADGSKTTRRPLNQEGVWSWGPIDWQ